MSINPGPSEMEMKIEIEEQAIRPPKRHKHHICPFRYGALRSTTFPSFTNYNATATSTLVQDGIVVITIQPDLGSMSYTLNPNFVMEITVYTTAIKPITPSAFPTFVMQATIQDGGSTYAGSLRIPIMEDGTSDDMEACGRIRIDSMAEPAFYVDLPYNEINGDGIDVVKREFQTFFTNYDPTNFNDGN